MPYQGEYAHSGKQWKVGMFETPCASPLKFCGYCLCAPCGAYYQREKLLGDPNAPYFCCMGTFPICCLASPCPRVPCLCLEVVCCLSCAVVSNRAYIQGTRHVRNTDCDNCIIWCTCCLQCTICIAQVLGYRVDPSVKNAVDLLYCTVLGCMQTQQDLEVDDTFFGPPDQSMK